VATGADDIAVAQALLRAGLLVRPGQDFGMPGYIRVTIGPLDLMERVAEELARALPGRERLEGATWP
jgi:histidinol-phosphate aminotransferase